MSIISKVANALKAIPKHIVGFLKFIIYMGGPLLIAYVLGDLLWLASEEYGNMLFFTVIIYIYVGIVQNKMKQEDFSKPFDIGLMLVLWKNIVLWPVKAKK
ncbi:hypothetical protein [Pseudoalteromonas sp. SK20]|uniref:hypothetical protein n=1 Tax=Pseudoalteromonas sp. SK20 TaxID=1938367 RepID=UPI000975E2E0|nr:hypothetical protein [Pseudoalteromonas sp. SK20]